MKPRVAPRSDLEAHIRDTEWYRAHHIWDHVRPYVLQPHTFRAYRATTSQTITAASTEVRIDLNEESWDSHDAYDKSVNFRWVCGMAGKWQFNSGARIQNNSGGAADIYVRLRIGGDAGTVFLHTLYEKAVPHLGVVMRHGSTQYVFALGDQVSMYIYTTAQPVAVIASGVWATFMDARFVSV